MLELIAEFVGASFGLGDMAIALLALIGLALVREQDDGQAGHGFGIAVSPGGEQGGGAVWDVTEGSGGLEDSFASGSFDAAFVAERGGGGGWGDFGEGRDLANGDGSGTRFPHGEI